MAAMFLLSILIIGCDSDAPAPPAAAEPATSAPDDATEEPLATAEEPATAAEEPAAASGSGAPFVQVVDELRRVDGFTFWGWSADSKHFAFETFYPGTGGRSCDQVATLHIVSAATDQYLTPPVTTRYPSMESDVCPGPSPEEAMAMLRPDILGKWEISAASYIAPLLNTDDSDDWLVEPTSGPWFRLTLAQTGTSSASDAIGNAGFRLEMHEVGHAGVPKVIESGERIREGILSYQAAMVFPAPDDSHVAIILKMERVDYEGSSYGFMSNGTTRIADMVVEDGD